LCRSMLRGRMGLGISRRGMLRRLGWHDLGSWFG
jgi:hypothetical protein